MPYEPKTPIEAERQLVERILGGDRAAYALFLQDFGAIAQRVFRRFADPDDLFQDFGLHLWEGDFRRLRQWTGQGSLRAFVRRVAFHLALDEARKVARMRKREVLTDDGEPPLPDATSTTQLQPLPPDHPRSLNALRELLSTLMEELSVRDREVIALAYFEQLKGEEAARRLDISHSAYRKRHERALGRLRVLIDDGAPELRDLLKDLTP
jgi:RNA polymerase sigma-70 factor (ECF subfamily)